MTTQELNKLLQQNKELVNQIKVKCEEIVETNEKTVKVIGEIIEKNLHDS